jgi:hypothetical protein
MAKAKAKTKDTESDKPKAKAKVKEKERASGPRPRNDAYVMMLFIALLAIVGASALQYLDFEEYGKKAPDGKAPAPTPPALGTVVPAKAGDIPPPGGPPGGPMPMPPDGMGGMGGMMP